MSTLQYIVIRRDLINWPLGAIIAQGCHAATAAIASFYSHPDTTSYLKSIDRMHKVVLGIENENELVRLASKLRDENIDHYLWIEQPENICTALATRPYEKLKVQSYFKDLKLLS